MTTRCADIAQCKAGGLENKGRVGEAVIWSLAALVHGAGLTGWEARLGCVRVYTCACVRVTMFCVTIMMFKQPPGPMLHSSPAFLIEGVGGSRAGWGTVTLVP